MTRLLLVLPDEVRRTVLAVLARAEGLEVVSASGGLEALTQLERSVPDVILCDDRPGDLSAQEVHEIVRSEPLTRRTPLLLLTDRPPAWLGVLGDQSVPRSHTSLELLDRLLEAGVNTHHDPFGLNPRNAARSAQGDVQMSGSLELMHLFDLLGSLNQVRKTGRMVVRTPADEALLYLQEGEVQHAEHRGQFGQAALVSALCAAELAPASTFSITSVPEALFRDLPRTVVQSTPRLLLELAVQLDHLRAQVGRPLPLP